MMTKLSRVLSSVAFMALAASMLSAGSAAAATNLGFETGDTTGWTSGGTGLTGATPSYGGFHFPKEGAFFGFAEAGAEDVYTTLSQTFNLNAGDKIIGYAGFRVNDSYFVDTDPTSPTFGKTFNDNGYLSVNTTQLQYWDVQSLPFGGTSGWVRFSYTAATAGAYTLQIGAENTGDNLYSSGTVLDSVRISPVPEPQAWALMLVGLGGLGLTLRRLRSASPARVSA